MKQGRMKEDWIIYKLAITNKALYFLIPVIVQNMGGDVKGTFQAWLLDQSDKKSGYYNVSGSFSVRRVQ